LQFLDCFAASPPGDGCGFATSTPVIASREAAWQSSENPRYFIKSICITKNDVYLCRVKISHKIL
jgi:hypothetical protein